MRWRADSPQYVAAVPTAAREEWATTMFQKLFVPVIPHTTWGNDQDVSGPGPHSSPL